MLVGPSREAAAYDVDEEETEAPEDAGGYSLLDPETGILTQARGDLRPLVQQTFRALQPSANPLEFWAAVATKDETTVGLYNSRTFTVRPVLKLSKIVFNSMDIWIDEAEGTLYFVYEGQLLSAPIKVK